MNRKETPRDIIVTSARKENIETRAANRMKSIFSAIGQIVNDFYLEVGIYCIGLLNASLVAWSIYTDLVANNQPLAYAIALGIIALIAVEGLAVYLVGAAAKTNNGWLWFFSVVFAGFFTLAHYRVAYSNTHISDYITYAIPFFVVIGYWARTLKVQVETGQVDKAQMEREALERKWQIEDEERRASLELKRLGAEQKHLEKLAKIEVSTKSVQPSVKQSVQPSVKGLTPDDIKNAVSEAESPVNVTQLAKSLHISRTTLYNRLNSMVDSGEMIKNGNGYEVVK